MLEATNYSLFYVIINIDKKKNCKKIIDVRFFCNNLNSLKESRRVIIDMIIKTLVENTASSASFNVEHGLSLYIETSKHKILFDCGASSLFIENAKKLGVKLEEIDCVVISHGHYDHGGGLKSFLEINSKAIIYFNKHAFEKHYSQRKNNQILDIGLNDKLLPNQQFYFINDDYVIDEELELFSGVKPEKMTSIGSKNLLMKNGTEFEVDDFRHEQNLIIRENGKNVLIAGCAHNGIVNIIDHANKNKGVQFNEVIGGFHLYHHSKNTFESPELITQIAKYLNALDTIFYTCHCTGEKPYLILKEILGEKIHYLRTGDQLILE